MFYETMIGLANLNKPKNKYDIKTKLKNRLLLFETRLKLKKLYRLPFPDRKCYDRLIDFLDGAYALNKFINLKDYDMSIWKTTEKYEEYLISDNRDMIFSAEIRNPSKANWIYLDINRERRSIKVKYEDPCEFFIDEFYIEDPSAMMYTPYARFRYLAAHSIEVLIKNYIDTATQKFYDLYA